MPTISVIIKTLNEEEHVSKAISSSLAAIAPYGGEVVVADSVSADRTMEIALGYPITVVQLKNAGERCCGIAPQLGFQFSHGEFIYLLDGDMEMQGEFIASALKELDADPKLAGVGGFVQEMQVNNTEFVSRQNRQIKRKPADRAYVDCLNGGGLYRRAAIENARYFSDRNLHSFEEFELGARLRAKGWKLMFLDRLSANHYGYTLNSYRLLWRRVESKYVYGSGEVLRAAIDCSFAAEALRKLPVLRPAIGVWLYWSLVLIAILSVDSAWIRVLLLVLAAAAPVVAMTLKNRRSLNLGAYNVAAWHAVAFGLLMGFCRRRVDPTTPIEAHLLRTTGG